MITPHYFRHNCVTLLYEAGIDPLIAMKIVGHTDYQTTANIYTHLGNETLRRAAVDMRGAFDPKGKSSPFRRFPSPGSMSSAQVCTRAKRCRRRNGMPSQPNGTEAVLRVSFTYPEGSR